MTPTQVAMECKKVWLGALKTKDGIKPRWAKKKYMNGCPACQDVLDRFGKVNTDTGLKCKECLFLPLWGVKNKSCPCERGENSPYKIYADTLDIFDKNRSKYGKIKRNYAAVKIIEFIEKNYSVEEEQ